MKKQKIAIKAFILLLIFFISIVIVEISFAQKNPIGPFRKPARRLPINNARFISQTIPRDMLPGQKYQISVTFKNIGKKPWVAVNYALGSQNPSQNNTFAVNKISLLPSRVVLPGQDKVFTFKITAPSKKGNYNCQWQMFEKYGRHIKYFGQRSENVVINVNTPPVLDALDNQSTFEHKPLQLEITANDRDGDNLAYSASNLPPGAVFDSSTRKFSWNPQHSQAGIYSNIHFEVSDGTATISKDIILTVLKTVIFGTIYEKNQSGQIVPLEGVTIDMLNLDRVTVIASGTTDITGHFDAFKDTWPDGNYFIRASKSGYKTYWGFALIRANTMMPFSITMVEGIPPAGTIIINNGAQYTNSATVNLSLSAADSGSGMGPGAEMRFSNDNSIWSSPGAYAANKSWDLTSESGAKTVYVKFKDAAGNWSDAFSDTITLDTTLGAENEPNNDFTSANNFNLNSTFFGSINLLGDRDYFKVTATAEAGMLNISLTNVPGNVDAMISLYDSAHNYLGSSYSGGYGREVHFQKEYISPGDYYILVSDWGDDNSYNAQYLLNIDLSTIWIFSQSVFPEFFSPNSDTVNDTCAISAFITNEADWTMSIKNTSGVIKRAYQGSGSYIEQAWDGKDQAGQVVPDGVYTYTIEAAEIGTGNQAPSISGQVSVDSTLPNAVITEPLPGVNLSGGVAIKGVANDINFQDASLYYGEGQAPLVWNPIADIERKGPAPSILANWDTTALPQGDYAIRLEVNDKAGNHSVATVPVFIQSDIPTITDFTVTPGIITPDGFDTDITNDVADIKFKLSHSGFITVEVYDQYMSSVVKTIWNGPIYPDPAKGMQVEFQWDGKDNAGALVKNGEFYVMISTTDGQQQSLSLIVNNHPVISNFGVTPRIISPDGDFIDDQAEFHFALSEESMVTVEVYDLQNILIRTIVANDYVNYGFGVSYYWDGMDDSMQLVPYGEYYFKVTGQAVTGNPLTELRMSVFVIDYTRIFNVNVQGNTFDPSLGQATQILYELNTDASLSIKIYNEENALVKNLVTNEPKAIGAHSETWDGKDNSGSILPNGCYYFIIEDSISGTPQIIYDPRGTGGYDISRTIAFSATDFDTLKNQTSILTYNSPLPAKINIKVRDFRYGGPAIRVIKYGEIIGSGQHQAYWDGRDEFGNIISYKPYTLALWGYTLIDNAMLIVTPRPDISQVLVTPIRFNPAPNPYTTSVQNSTIISFNLSQGPCNVTLDIYNANNILVRRLLNSVLTPQGISAVVWDGKNADGKILAPGYYKIELQAQKDGNYSDVVTGHIEVIY